VLKFTVFHITEHEKFGFQLRQLKLSMILQVTMTQTITSLLKSTKQLILVVL